MKRRRKGSLEEVPMSARDVGESKGLYADMVYICVGSVSGRSHRSWGSRNIEEVKRC